MNLTIISASTRKDAQSRIVSDYLAQQLQLLSIEATIVDLYENTLPIYNDTKDGPGQEVWGPMSDTFAKSDGFVFVSPEWDGMFSVGLHNLFHYAKNEFADKPVLLVGVSDGRGGRYPLTQMRIMGYKNRHFVIIPESIFIDYVKESMKDGVPQDQRLADRIIYALRVLVRYSEALVSVRESGVTDYKKYGSGW